MSRKRVTLRLHRNLQRGTSGDFAEDSFRFSGNSGNPPQPEPPRICSRYADLTGARGGLGESEFPLSPGGFAPLSTRESGL